ncbi:MAG: tetratricopeptide repeat protein, partial [Akkermansiaceae bacterium]
AAALKVYGSRKNPDDASALDEFISQNPTSPWTPTLSITYGTRLYHQARFSEALEHFEKAWTALEGMLRCSSHRFQSLCRHTNFFRIGTRDRSTFHII